MNLKHSFILSPYMNFNITLLCRDGALVDNVLKKTNKNNHNKRTGIASEDLLIEIIIIIPSCNDQLSRFPFFSLSILVHKTEIEYKQYKQFLVQENKKHITPFRRCLKKRKKKKEKVDEQFVTTCFQYKIIFIDSVRRRRKKSKYDTIDVYYLSTM